MMTIYICIAICLIYQGMSYYVTYRNFRYVVERYKTPRTHYQPKAAIIAPYKGIDTTFEKNVEALFELDYPEYEIYFVVDDKADPSYPHLKQVVQDKTANHIKAYLIVSGKATIRSQKVHNQLEACKRLSADVEVLAFVDSDVCVKKDWLTHMVYPLNKSRYGASTGYRIYIPTDRRMSTYCLSAINTYFSSFLGPHRYNATWGGSMAIRKDVFDQANVIHYWNQACTDDYSLTAAIRKENLKVYYAPGCLVPSYDQMTWPDLFSFATRQFIITRVYMNSLWRAALLGLHLHFLIFWVSLIYGVMQLSTEPKKAIAILVIPVSLYLANVIKAIARQYLVFSLFSSDKKALVIPAILDILFHPLIHLLSLGSLIKSACTRQIRWRGIRYKLISPEKTDIYRLSS